MVMKLVNKVTENDVGSIFQSYSKAKPAQRAGYSSKFLIIVYSILEISS